jgi:hypothetical protein
MKTCICIATPTSSGIVKADYVSALANLVADLSRRRIDSHFININASSLPHQRDLIAYTFRKKREYTHLLCIDSDMWFPSDLAFRLLSHDKPIVGTIYARRQLHLEAIQKRLLAGASLDAALAKSYSFIVNPPARFYADEPGLVSVGGFGMGFVLIRRDCLELIAAKSKLDRYAGPNNETILGFFQPIKEMSEDISFCYRWHVLCQQPLWADPSAQLLHIGDFNYGAPYEKHRRQRLNIVPMAPS